jgi:hypothetical protein
LIESIGLKTDTDSGASNDSNAVVEDPDEASDFSVDFEEFRPIYFEAREQSLRIGIRGSRFAQEKNGKTAKLEEDIDVSATYRPVIDLDGSVWLIRDPDIQLRFAGPAGRRLTLPQTAMKANVIEGFDKLFPPTLLKRKFQIPTTMGMPALAGKFVRVVGIDLNHGWCSVSLEKPSS